MYNTKKLILSITWVVLGTALIILSLLGLYDNYTFDGLGGGFIAVGIVQIIRHIKYKNNPDYREKIDIAISDERYRSIRTKGWAIAGYTMALGQFVAGVVAYFSGYELVSNVLVTCGALIMMIYVISIYILNRIN